MFAEIEPVIAEQPIEIVVRSGDDPVEAFVDELQEAFENIEGKSVVLLGSCSLFNHACRDFNVRRLAGPNPLTFVVEATRDIEVGEELLELREVPCAKRRDNSNGHPARGGPQCWAACAQWGRIVTVPS